EDRHQRALARAVLADQPADLSRGDRQLDAVQRHRGAESLADAVHPEAKRHFFRSGSSSVLISGVSMLAFVATWTPVSIRFSTGCPLRCATIVFTARYPMLTGSCTTSPSMPPSRSPLTRFGDASKPTNFTLPAQPLSCSTRSIANDPDSLGVKMPSIASEPSGLLYVL